MKGDLHRAGISWLLVDSGSRHPFSLCILQSAVVCGSSGRLHLPECRS